MTEKKHRALTAGEITLAKTVFGDSIDYAKVKVYGTKFSRFQPDNFNAAPDGNLYMVKNYSDDFSKSPAEDQAALMHELTHVWQIQNNTMNLKMALVKETIKAKFNYAATSQYRLVPGKDFNGYGFEQQAGIIEDYILLGNGKKPVHTRGNEQDTASHAQTIAKLLAKPDYAARPKHKRFGR